MAKGTVIGVTVIAVTALTVYMWPRSSHQKQDEEPVVVEVVLPEVVPAPPVALIAEPPLPDVLTSLSEDSQLPHEVEHMTELFQTYAPFAPLVQTVSYMSKVQWLSGRSAYLGDYAAHYKTSKHFISRSLRGIGNYVSDVVSKGERFNVLRTDKDIQFHLVLDLSRLKLWTYAYDATADERFLLKCYSVAAGKRCLESASGCLTPTGIFALGEEIAVYKEGSMGYRHQEKIEMISVFGKRWIPCSYEIADCSGPCKGLGIHGMPWHYNSDQGVWVEERESAGHYQSDGCVRMLSEDIAELFAVIVSRPSYLHIVRDYTQAQLPGKVM